MFIGDSADAVSHIFIHAVVLLDCFSIDALFPACIFTYFFRFLFNLHYRWMSQLLCATQSYLCSLMTLQDQMNMLIGHSIKLQISGMHYSTVLHC